MYYDQSTGERMVIALVKFNLSICAVLSWAKQLLYYYISLLQAEWDSPKWVVFISLG